MSSKDKVQIESVEPHLRLENQLCFAMYSASRAMTRFYAPLLKKLHLTYPQYLALMVLWAEDGQTIQSLADNLEIDQASATPLIQRLEKLGFVNRERSQEDERRVLVWLTDKGKGIYSEAGSISSAVACGSGITLDEAVYIIGKMGEVKASLAEQK